MVDARDARRHNEKWNFSGWKKTFIVTVLKETWEEVTELAWQ